MSERVFVGRVNPDARTRDLENFFRDEGFKRIRDVHMKKGYAFVEFESKRDADDAVHDCDGKEFFGSRLTVERAKSDPFSSGGRRDRRSPSPRRSGGGGGSRGGFGGNNRPYNTEWKIIVENLSSRVGWQDLKDLFRGAGEVTFTKANTDKIGEGVVEFKTQSEMKKAMKKFDNYEFFDKKMHLVDGSPSGRSRSRSRSNQRSRSNSRSRSRSKSRSRSRSDEKKSQSRSKSDDGKSRSRSKSPDAGEPGSQDKE